MDVQFSSLVPVCKVDRKLGLVFGYAMVCKVGGKKYFDSQDEHIPEQVMLEGSTDFMKSDRTVKDMHTGEPIGTAVFAFPMTQDIADALDIQVKKTGLLIAMAPDAEVLEKFATGERTGFSIGGKAAYRDEEIDDGEA